MMCLYIVDLDMKLKYAFGCYEFGSYCEAAIVCSEIIGSKVEKLHQQAILLKGKAIYHDYQRKLSYLTEKKPTLLKSAQKNIADDCFKSTKEAISLLGKALDLGFIDEDGSKLLDWAMIDCVRETNWLGKCKRCLLCRRGGVKIRESHIYSKFTILRAYSKTVGDEDSGVETGKAMKEESSGKSFIFGLNKHQMKSAGDCWYRLCCGRCEEIMSQNAENDYARLFPSTSGTVQYSSWLFNFCSAILFRTFSTVKFPHAFNTEEVYTAFLNCRQHLLSLPVKVKGDDTSSDSPRFPSLSGSSELKPHLFVVPPTVTFEESREYTLPFGFTWIATHMLVDGRMDSAGWIHFAVSYFDGLGILLQFKPSICCKLPEDSRVLPLEGSFRIREDSEAVKLMPKGLWMLYHLSAMKNVSDFTEFLQQVPPVAAKNMITKGTFSELEAKDAQITTGNAGSANPRSSHAVQIEGDTSLFQFYSTSNKPVLSLLPEGFKIVQPLPNSPINKTIELPKGHKILLHTVDEAHDLIAFLAVGSFDKSPHQHPYIMYHQSRTKIAYLDGCHLATTDGEICLGKFLVEHDINSQWRNELSEIHKLAELIVKEMLAVNGFFTLELLILHLKCHQHCTEDDNLPSFGKKCSMSGCWYCNDLCHYCMQRAVSVNISNIETRSYRYCSEKCKDMFNKDPTAMSQRLFVMDHREELLKCRGLSVLDILNISREYEAGSNVVGFLHLCVGNGSDGISQGKFYILWQIRSMDEQNHISFRVTQDCASQSILFSPSAKDSKTEKDVMIMEPKLRELLLSSIRALDCVSICEYLQSVITSPQ